MCKKQVSVSYSSTESAIISLDAGLKMDGKPALDLGDLIVTVLHGHTDQNDKYGETRKKSPTRKKIHGKIDGLNNVDFVSSNANSSGQEALLYIFEDKEAVIKIIIKGRSPTMRHASRTHRVPLISLNEQLPSTVKPVTLANSANSSEWNNDDKWSSQVRKSGEMSGTSTEETRT